MAEVYETWMDSPVGPLRLSAEDGAVVAVEFHETGRDPGSPSGVLRAAAEQLAEYFAGRRRVFEFPLKPAGTTFQRRVWDALLAIPIGQTRSYAEVARATGDIGAMRAVGAANGANPIAIVIPCHRVIASDGTLHGYGGGLRRKQWLLEHEQAMAGTTLFTGARG